MITEEHKLSIQHNLQIHPLGIKGYIVGYLWSERRLRPFLDPGDDLRERKFALPLAMIGQRTSQDVVADHPETVHIRHPEPPLCGVLIQQEFWRHPQFLSFSWLLFAVIS